MSQQRPANRCTMLLATVFQALAATVLLVQLQPGSAQISISPDTIFRPGELVEIVLDRDNYTEVKVRQEVNVKIDCSFRRQQFINRRRITNESSVTIRWLYQQQLENLAGFRMMRLVLDERARIDIVGRFNEIVNITGTLIPTGAVDGTTGIYTCEVCQDRGTPGQVCVNSSLPIRGSPDPPDIDEGQPGDLCSTDFLSRTMCKVGTNFCIDPSNIPSTITLQCAHNMSAPFTPNPIGVWFVNGLQINDPMTGMSLPNTSDIFRPHQRGQQLQLSTGGGNFPRGNYTCLLRNIAGNDTETSFITDCMPPTIQPGRRIGFSRIQVGFGPLCLTSARVTITCDLAEGATPPITYTWLRDRVILPETGNRLVVNMAGVYTCVARNRFGNDSSSSAIIGVPEFDVQIVGLKGRGCSRLDPIPPMLPETICVFLRESIRFNCTGNMIEKPDSSILPKLSTINATADDTGTFTCQAATGGCTRTATLNVFDPARVNTDLSLPKTSPGNTVIGAGRPDAPQQIPPGQNVHLVCPTTGIGRPETVWQRRVGDNTTRVVSDPPKIVLIRNFTQSIPTLVLIINDFQESDEGEYICVTRNVAGSDMASVILELEPTEGEPPEIITDPPEEEREDTVTIGNNACLEDDESIWLNCSLSQGSEPVSYKWTRNGNTVSNFPPVHLLHVDSPGTYVCSVSNSFGSDSAVSVINGLPAIDFSVTVIGGRDGGCSRLTLPPRDVDICAFPWETITFTCLLAPGSDSSSPLVHTPYGQAPSQFYLNNCQTTLNGIYECSSTNECGTRSSSVNVQVFEPAKIERELKGVRRNLPSPMRDVTQVYVGGGRKVVNLRAGESIQLFCPYSGIEEPRAIWLKKEEYGESLEHVQLSSHIRQQNLTLGGVSTSVLSITRLRGDDFGQYICVVHNRAGRDKDSVIIREVGEWYAGCWSQCARHRTVACVGVGSGQHMDDDACSAEEMPESRSPCGYDD